jgi:hypothetical protein
MAIQIQILISIGLSMIVLRSQSLANEREIWAVRPPLDMKGTLVAQASSTSAASRNSKTRKKTVKRKRDVGQRARVKIDGAAIYEAPNFDSPVLEYMDTNKKVLISKKLYSGVGGMGAFYKIKLSNGVYGYITDTDVEINRGAGSDGNDDDQQQNARENREKEPDEGAMSDDPTVLMDEKSRDDDEPAFANSIYMNRFVGLMYTSYNYAETLRKKSESTTVGMFGFQYSGPTPLLGGVPLDVGLVFTTTAPDFYNKISSSTSGYMLILDTYFLMPIYESSQFLFFYGLGPVLRYSAWEVSLKSKPGTPAIDSQEITLGAAAEVGAAARLGAQFLVRADAKYHYEKEAYLGYGAALMYRF